MKHSPSKAETFETKNNGQYCTDENLSNSILIDSLKQKIKEQQNLLTSAQKCLICLDTYKIPLVSINCWHVHCEACWLCSLGAKKLCPQCKVITSPVDLRKIYM